MGYSKTNPFDAVAYNVQNLSIRTGFRYDDYKPDYYGETELSNKLNVICRVLRKIGDYRPAVVLLQEIEVDRTPESHPSATDRPFDTQEGDWDPISDLGMIRSENGPQFTA